MRYFEKTANPLGMALSAVGKFLGEDALKKVVTSKGFGTAAELLGSKGTTEWALKSKMPFLADMATPGGKLFTRLQDSIGSRMNPLASNSVTAKTMEAFKEQLKPMDTFSNAIKNSPNKLLGGLKWLGSQATGIGDKHFIGSLGQSFANDTKFMAGGNLYQGSRLGNATKLVTQRGMDAYMIGDAAFGKLQEGETRAGKVLGNMGGLLGFRTSTKILPGLMRSSLYSEIGSKLGNQFGKPKKTWNQQLGNQIPENL